jgi:signal transduction histidine kinase
MNPTSARHYLVPSLIASACYILLCSLYIFISGRIASVISGSVEQLAQIERIKGIAFIFITGIIIFCISTILLRRTAKQHSLITDQKHVIDDQRTLIATSERRALAGTFAASIAHDINNVLGLVLYNISELKETEGLLEKSGKNLHSLEHAFSRIEEMAKRLMVIGRKNVQSTISEFDVSKLVTETVEMSKMHTRIRTCNVSLVKHNTPVIVSSNPHVIEQCILNLLLNSADATLRGGVIEVHVTGNNTQAVIEVHDNGPGIPLTEQTKVFSAFHTTKEHGAGLGLAGVKASIEILSGNVEIGTSPLGGALFRICVPRMFNT